MSEFLDRYAQWGYPQRTPVMLPTVIRVNTLRCSVDDCVSALRGLGCTVTPLALPYAFAVSGGHTLVATLPYLNGWFYLQELASQYAVAVVDVSSANIVVDLAAAPGSKTTHASMMMNGGGTIVACDISHERLLALQSNCARMGASNVVAYQIDAQFADSLVRNADVVLCDVPCSGNFTQSSDWFDKRTLADVRSRVAVQRRLLTTAVDVCRKGGRIVYSTCSLEIEENEEVVQWALSSLGVRVCPIALSFGSFGLSEVCKDCRRLWPTQHKTGGFFIALLEKM